MVKSHSEMNSDYQRKAYDRINANVFKGNREVLKQFCAEHDTSLQYYINSLIQADLARYGIEFDIPEKRILK